MYVYYRDLLASSPKVKQYCKVSIKKNNNNNAREHTL